MFVFVRLNRYIKLFSWLILIAVKTNLFLTSATVLTSIFSRLGTILGFILTIKVAVWLIAPDSIKESIVEYSNVESTFFLTFLCFAPGFIFVLAAICQKIHRSISATLAATLAEDLTFQKIKIQLAELNERELKDPKMLKNVGTEMRKLHRSIHTIITLVLYLVSDTIVFFVTVSLGFFFSPTHMTIIFAICVISSTLLICLWQPKLYRVQDQLQRAREDSLSITNDINRIAMNKMEDVELREKLNKTIIERIPLLSNITRIKEKSNSSITLLLEIGQALIVVTFLISLAWHGNAGQLQIAAGIIFVLLLRFMISYLKSIVRNVIRLNTFYAFSTSLKQALS